MIVPEINNKFPKFKKMGDINIAKEWFNKLENYAEKIFQCVPQKGKHIESIKKT